MNKLDLHTTRYTDVKRKVIRFIESNWDSGNALEIVTGNSTSMKEVVIEVLEEYQLDYRVGDYLGINKGYIKVYT